MIANPVVEELILAGYTPGGVRTMFESEHKGLKAMFDASGQLYTFGTIRICPPLRVAKRFRAFVTWMPTGKAGR